MKTDVWLGILYRCFEVEMREAAAAAGRAEAKGKDR